MKPVNPVDEYENICARQLLDEHARYNRIVEMANTSRLEFILGGSWGSLTFRRVTFQLIGLAGCVAGLAHLAVSFNQSRWLGVFVAWVMMETACLHTRLNALATLWKEYPQGWPSRNLKKTIPIPPVSAKREEEIPSLPG